MDEETEILKSIYPEDIVKCDVEWYVNFIYLNYKVLNFLIVFTTGITF